MRIWYVYSSIYMLADIYPGITKKTNEMNGII